MRNSYISDCLILSESDLERLKIEEINLGERVYEGQTKTQTGFRTRRIIQKLEKEILRKAINHEADIAIIRAQTDSCWLKSSRSYYYHLYRR